MILGPLNLRKFPTAATVSEVGLAMMTQTLAATLVAERPNGFLLLGDDMRTLTITTQQVALNASLSPYSRAVEIAVAEAMEIN